MLRPGIFGFWQNDGPISREDRLNNMRLLAEVLPAVREIGKELDLKSPFEVAPGSRPLAAGAKSPNRSDRWNRCGSGTRRPPDDFVSRMITQSVG